MAEKMLGNIVQKINHLSGQDEKKQTLRKNLKTLSCRADDVKETVEAEEFRSGKKRKRVVDNWLGEVEMMKNKVQKLEEIGESQISSLLLGNRIDKLIKEIEELHEEGGFREGLLLDTCKTKAEPLLAPELTIQTSKRNLEELFKYLMDDEVWCIGIHGIGGVGKTTLALHIHNRLVQDVGTFGYRPYWVTVSQENSIGKLQDDIAKNLKLDLSNESDERKRAAKLSRALTREKCVLIFDDVWEKIALDKVGIPDKVKGHKTCKLILTTRSLDVCRRIGCQAKFKVQPLNEEEAWKLFEENLGQQTELSPEVRDIAMPVAAKCAGLPLAIITMAGSMREVNDIQEWRNVLKTLEELTMEQEDMENEVYPILEFSYSRLKDMKLKLCFLYCALYPEDRNIERDELIGYFISEGLIDEGKPWQAKFDEGHSMLNTLEMSCLLESCKSYDGRRCVKMHDLIRDMALKITKAGHPRFMVKAGVGLEDIPAEWEWTDDLDMVSLMDNLIGEIPHGRSPRCPRLSTLLLNENCLRKIADSFFEHMHALHVLDLSKNSYLEKLPNSISDLENLTALKLQDCTSLTYVPPLGKLRALQELDLSFTRIKDVPEGVDRLHALHVLDLSWNEDLEKLPNSISDLENLTALKLQGCKSLTYVPPLGKLRALQELDLSFTRIKEVPEGVDRLHALHVLDLSMNRDLEKLPNSISDLENLTALKLHFCKSLTYVPPLGKLRALQELDLSFTRIKEVPEGVDRLHALHVLDLSKNRFLEKLPNSISDLENLTALKLQRCTSLTYVPPLGKLRALQELDLSCTHIKEVPEGVDRLHALHVLDLSGNEDLEKLPNSISDLENLTALKLQGCKSLTYVPPLGKLRALQELDLSFTHIKEVPEGVDRLHALHVLDLSMNQDLEKLPNSISDLENLTALKLHFCKSLTYVPPLGKLRALQELDLSFTRIKEVPEGVDRLHALHVLDLSKNRFLEKLPNSISDLENLTALKLQRCTSLIYVPPLGKLRALQELDLSCTHIKEVPEGVDRLHALHVLDLSGNEDLEKLPNSISDLENLTALKLQFCKSLTYVPPLGKLRALQELDLSFTRIKEVPEGVDRLHALHVLDLSMNRDLEKLPNSISDLENLTALKLQFCKSLTYVPPLGKLRALQELDLSYTHIKEVPEGVDKLVNLKNLNMEGTRLERLPSGIILGKLSHLQRLGQCNSPYSL
ncbi:probable disease resistance protein At5g63020 [Actinidia eriantha]|uniref:probable disease resistance protein At5g63020 n=1 Tax=Actinidia eriantha TaxID=165200 RepID=UPI0025905981|nr:probable disease resistance protein At5g63020 [Actinidia eriantha]XP_057460640.1 probable disease resistance protein At5g63020 [Actinidia eriantha]